MLHAAQGHQGHPDVVVATEIVRVNACRVLVNLQLVIGVLEQGGTEEQFLHGQRIWVVLAQIHQLLVRVSFDSVRHGHLRATQVWKDAFFNFLVRLGDVLDLLLTLVLVAVHLEHTQNQIFVCNA